MISLKDYVDACKLALFSDDRGIIYEAHPRAAPSQTAQEPAREKLLSRLRYPEAGSHDELVTRYHTTAMPTSWRSVASPSTTTLAVRVREVERTRREANRFESVVGVCRSPVSRSSRSLFWSTSARRSAQAT